MESANLQIQSEPAADYRFAIVVEGVSERWQMNVIQIRGHATRVTVELDGYGAISAPAVSLTRNQALHLARHIIDLVGS
jgi:hypothetical protein